MAILLRTADIFTIVGSMLCAGLWMTSRYGKKFQKHPYPPGPPGLPLIGNVLDMPEKEDWEQARKWGGKYGDLVFVKIFRTPFLFVNSAEAANDLFAKRGNNYSSRPDMLMVNLSGWAWLAGIMPYGEELRKTRLLSHRFFQPGVVDRYLDLHTQSANRLVARLSRNPEGFLRFTRHFAGEQIMKVAYGHDVCEENDPYIDLAEKGLVALGESERFYLVNVLPFLRFLPKWFPGAGFLRFAERSRKLSSDMMDIPYAEVKQQVLQGIAGPSMAREFIEEHLAEQGIEEDEELIKKALGVVYVGGSDTTVSVLQTFFLAMVLHPEIQKKAHEELDRVLGNGNAPTFKDRSTLPYVNAIVDESLRWQAVVPLSILRTATEEDVYNGYYIPAGTVVCPNIWAMLRNGDEYDDPDEFNPERWLKECPPTNANKFAFGFGRRICPGKYFAENSLFIAIASILTVFIIEKVHDEQGKQVVPEVKYTPHHVRHPEHFQCKAVVRSCKKDLLSMIVDSIHPN